MLVANTSGALQHHQLDGIQTESEIFAIKVGIINSKKPTKSEQKITKGRLLHNL